MNKIIVIIICMILILAFMVNLVFNSATYEAEEITCEKLEECILANKQCLKETRTYLRNTFVDEYYPMTSVQFQYYLDNCK